MDYNDKLEALEREQSELRQMIGEGITFDVEVTYTRRKPGLLGFFRKREKITEKKVFRVQEPTLATLDRLSALWLQMSIDETKLSDEDYFKTAKKMAAQEARKLAQVVAVAVLGEDYYDVTDKGGYLVRKPNETRLARLTSLFLHTVTPSQLLTLAILITNVSNLGDFINSIRLMSATRTSDPTQLRATGLKSPHGRRGSVCAHFGWTLDYLLHGISWGTVQRMIVDAPGAEEEDTKPGTTEVVLTEENAGEVLDLINKLNR
jgi:hypothetical protein